MPFHSKQVPWNWGRKDPLQDPTENAQFSDICWAAGVYEGEGTCGGSQGKGKHAKSAYVHVSQKDCWLVGRLRALFGGNTRVYSQKGIEYSRWELTGPRAIDFMFRIYLFLSPRRKEQVRSVIYRRYEGLLQNGCF